MGINALAYGLCGDVDIKAGFIEMVEVLVVVDDLLVNLNTAHCIHPGELLVFQYIFLYLSDIEEGTAVLNNVMSNLFNVDILWDGKDLHVSAAYECIIMNTLEPRWEEEGIQGETRIESFYSDGLDILMHDAPSHLNTIVKCLCLNSLDRGVDDYFSGAIWSILSIESIVDVGRRGQVW